MEEERSGWRNEDAGGRGTSGKRCLGLLKFRGTPKTPAWAWIFHLSPSRLGLCSVRTCRPSANFCGVPVA